MKLFLCLSMVSFFAGAQVKDLYLAAEDQKYYKNDSLEGNNQFERINMNVKEINKLHGEIANLKAEIMALKKEVMEMKKSK